MYIEINDLFMFLIYPLLGAIAYIFALKYQLKEKENELYKEKNKNINE